MDDGEREVWGGPYEQRKAVQRTAGLMLGDMGNANYFVCRRCKGWPTEAVFQLTA